MDCVAAYYLASIDYCYTLQIEEDEPTGFIRFEKFQPMMSRVLMERRYSQPQKVHMCMVSLC